MSQSVINKHTHAITVEHVQYAISKLKSGKSDCVENLNSDNFKNGTERFYCIAIFFIIAHVGAGCSTHWFTMIYNDSYS